MATTVLTTAGSTELRGWPRLTPAEARVRTARLALALMPAAWSVGAFASSRLHVAVDGALLRPDVAIVVGEAPSDGVLRDAAPLLVVELAPAADPQRWLQAGADAVWVLGEAEAEWHVPDLSRRVAADGHLELPGLPALTTRVRDLCRRISG